MIKNNQFYILRHGQTEYQTKKEHRIYPIKGSLNSIGLTEKGRKCIKQVALKLKKEKIDCIYSSDFLRARQTSLIVARGIGLSKSKIFLSKELRDSNLGFYHGKLKEKFYREMGKTPRDFNKKPEKGESLNDVLKRIVDFIKKVDKKHKDKRILIVSHGGPLYLLEGVVKKRMSKDFIKENYIQTGELKKLN